MQTELLQQIRADLAALHAGLELLSAQLRDGTAKADDGAAKADSLAQSVEGLDLKLMELGKPAKRGRKPKARAEEAPPVIEVEGDEYAGMPI